MASKTAIKVRPNERVTRRIFAPDALGGSQKVLPKRLVFGHRLGEAAHGRGQDPGLLGIRSDPVHRLFQAPSHVPRRLLLPHSLLLAGT
jgi:hypothetical protein